MKKGLLFYQQGWTDIMNQLALIDYYLTKYDHITTILRPDAKTIYEYYLRDKKNITKIYDSITHTSNVHPSFYEQFNKNEYDYLLHGKLDNNRYDQYKNRFMSDGIPSPDHFGKRFYTCYDIELETKINYLEFTRDLDLENRIYDEFIDKCGSEYALYHDNEKNDSDISFNKLDNITYINVNGITNNIFSMIKVLMYAKEIHVVDSFWASFCYVVDAKYNLLKDVDIFLYPFNKLSRWGGLIKDTSFKNKFEDDLNNAMPIKLNNWKIV
jgi:hypothetical protein